MTRRDFLAVTAGAAFSSANRAPAIDTFRPGGQPPSGDLVFLSLTEASALIKARRLSPVELTRACLDRIDRLDSRVGAFITVTREEALGAARAAEQEIARGRYRGPMHGIPFGVKDTHYTKGIRTTANTPVLADFVPDFDATVVARLKRAGAVLVGKTNLPEFSFGSAGGGGAFPDAHNPWNLARTPGGSSSGSAAALAAGLLTVATGGDTSGSIRNPATFCVVGMKPTYGRVSRHGIVVISWSLDHVGPMSRTVADYATLLNVIAGDDPADETSSDRPVPDYTRALRRGVRGLRVGVPKPAQFDGYHRDVMRAFEESLAVFRKLGASVKEVDLPPTSDVIDDVQQIVRIAEAASYHEPFLTTKADRYADATTVRRDLESGSLVTAVQYLRAQKVRARFVNDLTAVFRTLDVFLTPGMPAPAGEPVDVKQPFRRMFNVCGFPALVLPNGISTTPAGLPIGLQIAAKPFDEETIYAAAQAFESATDWHTRRPSL